MSGFLSKVGNCARQSTLRNSVRHFSRPTNRRLLSSPPKSRDRGPPSKENTQTDFNALDIFSTLAPPSTAIDSCMPTGFSLNSGLRIVGAGALLIGGEAFSWQPWASSSRSTTTSPTASSSAGLLVADNGQLVLNESVWGILNVVWPKPDLLILGTGRSTLALSAETRRHINELGVRVEVQDTRNAAAQYNMLATERGLQQVAAALLPVML